MLSAAVAPALGLSFSPFRAFVLQKLLLLGVWLVNERCPGWSRPVWLGSLGCASGCACAPRSGVAQLCNQAGVGVWVIDLAWRLYGDAARPPRLLQKYSFTWVGNWELWIWTLCAGRRKCLICSVATVPWFAPSLEGTGASDCIVLGTHLPFLSPSGTLKTC